MSLSQAAAMNKEAFILFFLLDHSGEMDVMTRLWKAEQGYEGSSSSIYNKDMYLQTCVSLFLLPGMNF